MIFFQLDRTALHCAAACGHLAVTEAILEHGADLEAKDKVNITKLLCACNRSTCIFIT